MMALVALIILALPIAWLSSEFSARRVLRMALGVAAMASAVAVSVVVNRFNYNAWYGGASKDLIDTAIKEIEDGHMDRVIGELRRLNLDYQPTYQNRAHYDELVNQAVVQMKGLGWPHTTSAVPSPFTRDAWEGHWENDTGFWIVINDIAGRLDVVRSGDNPKMWNVVLSDDSSSVTFTDGGYRHELKLKNKYEATHVWRGDNNTVWKTDTLHKLRRATVAERAFTQQK